MSTGDLPARFVLELTADEADVLTGVLEDWLSESPGVNELTGQVAEGLLARLDSIPPARRV